MVYNSLFQLITALDQNRPGMTYFFLLYSQHNVRVGEPLTGLTLMCTAGAIKRDELKTRGLELWTVLPQTGGRPLPGMGQHSFLE